ncbi:MAG: hypothetical protein RLY93_12405 [Sumerlaeia bacterium]
MKASLFLPIIALVALLAAAPSPAAAQTSPTLTQTDAVAFILGDDGPTTGTLAKVIVAGSLLEASGRNFWLALNDDVPALAGLDYGGELVVRRYLLTELVARPIRQSAPLVFELLADPETGWDDIGGDPARIPTDFEVARASILALVETYAEAVLADSAAAMTTLAGS